MKNTNSAREYGSLKKEKGEAVYRRSKERARHDN